MMSNENGAPSAAATLFDLRTVIAVLFGVYGVVLTALGLFNNDPAELEKSAGIDMNLWTGIGMLVVAAIFLVWVWQRPLVHRSVEGDG
jgi:drug/metabolite transporter (DMT)-like permease